MLAVAAAPQHLRRWRPPAVVLFFPDPSCEWLLGSWLVVCLVGLGWVGWMHCLVAAAI